MKNVTYKVKTQANMKICQQGKFEEMYKGGEEMLHSMSR